MMHYGLAPNLRGYDGVASPSGRGSYRFSTMAGLSSPVKGRASETVYVSSIRTPSYGDAAQFVIDAQIRAVKLAEATSRWRRFVLDRAAPDDVDSLTETVDAVLDVIAEIGPSALSLRDMHPETVHPEHLAAVLRASSNWRHDVPGWDQALEVARAAVLRANLDADDVLFGLV
jgi:hypothetical protein